MSAAAPNPSNLIMLAVLGAGAYWYFSRRALAAQPAPAGPRPAPGGSTAGDIARWAASDQGLWNNISRIIGAVTPTQTRAYYDANGRNSGPSHSGVGGGSTGDPYNPDGYYDAAPVNPAPGIDWDNFDFGDGGDYGVNF